MKRATWMVAALSVMAAGCSTTAPTANLNAPAQPDAQMTSDRSVLADGVTTPNQLSTILPKRLTQAEGDRLLVDLPADKLKGGFQIGQDDRKVQQWRRPYRFYRFGSLYYPYSLYGSYYYPYYSYYTPYYTYPYYFNYGSYYYPYRYSYRRLWW